jgi:hypothetical protein
MATQSLTLAAIVLSWLNLLAPPERFAEIPTYPEATETASERAQRYEDIAEDISAVVLEDSARAPVQRRAAALLVGIAWHESGFAKDVDLGPCAPDRVKKGGCDSGRAKGLWQIQAYDVPTRRDGARLALRLARRSLTACRELPVSARLAAYAGGTCASTGGQVRSRELWSVVQRLASSPPPSP